MKRKRNDPDKPSGHSHFTPAKKPSVISSDNKQNEHNDNRMFPATVNPSVPIQSIFRSLFQDLRHSPISNITRSHDQQTSLKPSTPINKRKCVLGLDLMTNETDGTPAQRSCVTEFASKQVSTSRHTANYTNAKTQRKKPRTVLQDITNISSSFLNINEDSSNQTFEATIDGPLTDVSEDDEMSAAYDSDYGGTIEDNVEVNWDCSSQERTDSESESDDIVVSVNQVTNLKKYNDEGDPTYTCSYCGTIMWYNERVNKRKNTRTPSFALCCLQGQVQLPLLKEPPEVLKKLLEGNDHLSRHFQRNSRPYNMVFSFTSLGGKCERSVQKGIGPNTFQLQGENYHLMGSLTPGNGKKANFGQMYIVDTENEIENRANVLSKPGQTFQPKKKDNLKKEIIELLMKMLDEVNPYVKQFRSAKDRFKMQPENAYHMRIVSDQVTDGRTYNTPTASEVAALIPGDFNVDMDKRDIVLQQNSGKLLRISEIHASYLALQYPLLFTYGEDGFTLGIKKRVSAATKKFKKDTISMRQFFCISYARAHLASVTWRLPSFLSLFSTQLPSTNLNRAAAKDSFSSRFYQTNPSR
ncbi:hypothetical protein Bca4012_031958 [Brassica carinata]|uniref:Helitron helicase-like domain-containing protein n=2 Tax=Brassica TaxID=3705 RepID=A0A3P6C8G3_BRAOL|nr:unnamed protein product [Brassica napus]VDD10500.1 unnamed protein product [Brassica oleracea]